MVTLKNKPRTQETPVNAKQVNTQEQSSQLMTPSSGYEQCRDKRIRENLERMQKLGLFDISSKLRSEIHSPNRSPKRAYVKRTPQPSPLQCSEPPRRSSRLQDSSPISYSELKAIEFVREKRARSVSRKSRSGPLVGQGVRPEIYTEQHEKLLGSCEQTWDLFVDGCGVDGRRVYDSINGKTCHQCRQKTLGHRTQCSSCVGVQGQFCGDCLYIRYGEHVLEANRNPNWTCPVCRDICNCSLCRRAKGWPATGALYRSITELGFKSVAHYLIQTKRVETKSGDIVTEDQVTVKKSLPFTDTEEIAEQNDTLNPKNAIMDKNGDELGENVETQSAVTEKISADTEEGNELGENKEIGCLDVVHDVRNATEDELKGDKREAMNESVTQDGVSSRLRSRRNKLDSPSIIQTPSKETKSSEQGAVSKDALNLTSKSASKVTPDGISSRLRSRHNKLDSPSIIQTPSKETELDESKAEEEKASLSEQGVSKVASGRKRKSAAAGSEPNPDSISGRLRQRRNRD